MKITAFLSLSEDEQLETVFKKGVIVAEKTEKPFIKKLYSLGAFYVEIHFNSLNEKILYKKVFKSGELLENYLKEIKINN